MLVYDSHSYIKTLVSLGVPEEQAEAHAAEFKKIVESDLATKNDMATLKSEISQLESRISQRIADSKVEIIKWNLGAMMAFVALMITILKFLN